MAILFPMGEKEEVNVPGVYAAMVLWIVPTFGQQFTTSRMIDSYNWLWLGLYGSAILVLSGAAVNFELSRWLK
jgi:hypothetical protein